MPWIFQIQWENPHCFYNLSWVSWDFNITARSLGYWPLHVRCLIQCSYYANIIKIMELFQVSFYSSPERTWQNCHSIILCSIYTPLQREKTPAQKNIHFKKTRGTEGWKGHAEMKQHFQFSHSSWERNRCQTSELRPVSCGASCTTS